jgi:hypothetical protein
MTPKESVLIGKVAISGHYISLLLFILLANKTKQNNYGTR